MNNQKYTFEKFKNAIISRNIWLNNFKQENSIIKELLIDAFYPYQVLIQHELKNSNPDSDYEIDTFLCIKEEPEYSKEIISNFNNKSYISISLYFLPKLHHGCEEMSAPQINLGFLEKEKVEKIISKFSKEVKMPVRITYE